MGQEKYHKNDPVGVRGEHGVFIVQKALIKTDAVSYVLTAPDGTTVTRVEFALTDAPPNKPQNHH